jgi:hypothetical protein
MRSGIKIRYDIFCCIFEGTPIRRSPFKECHAHTHVLCLSFKECHLHVVSSYLTHAGGAAMPECGWLTQRPPRHECLCILVILSATSVRGWLWVCKLLAVS